MSDFRPTEPMVHHRIGDDLTWREQAHVLWYVLRFADSRMVRFGLAFASGAWATGATLSGDAFKSGPNAPLLYLIDAPLVWAWLFFAYALLTLWRLFDPVRHSIIGLCINAYGAALWLLATAVPTVYLGGIRAVMAAEYGWCMMALWTLYRTVRTP